MAYQRKPREELSQKPSQIRNRLRRNKKRVAEDLEVYQKVVYKKDIKDWDLEELARGRPRDQNGDFRGVAPRWITPLIQQEVKRRLLTETYKGLATHAHLAIMTIGNLMTCEDLDANGKPLVDARTKLAAATFVLEHILGKPKAVVEVEGPSLAQKFLAGALVLDDGSPAHPVIDGQFEEGEEEEEDD